MTDGLEKTRQWPRSKVFNFIPPHVEIRKGSFPDSAVEPLRVIHASQRGTMLFYSSSRHSVKSVLYESLFIVVIAWIIGLLEKIRPQPSPSALFAVRSKSL